MFSCERSPSAVFWGCFLYLAIFFGVFCLFSSLFCLHRELHKSPEVDSFGTWVEDLPWNARMAAVSMYFCSGNIMSQISAPLACWSYSDRSLKADLKSICTKNCCALKSTNFSFSWGTFGWGPSISDAEWMLSLAATVKCFQFIPETCTMWYSEGNDVAKGLVYSLLFIQFSLCPVVSQNSLFFFIS